MQPFASSSPAARASALEAGIWSLAGVQLFLGLWQAALPGRFYDVLAHFGARNDHFLRDVSTYFLASGIALAIAARRPSWRAPVLAVVGFQYALHALNHLLDIGKADPSWVGPFDFVSLALGVLLIGWLYREASR
ncbi:MAG TPA: hypothetical protein VFG42_05885 [Baekduia sp.]|uniref:hypothetical protein n=1 Tax=Baekduia sp. TaxID=2600305 RepID=UPI002D788C5E|nr:hypothetical protein [Baekduia sp.]HET6506298.1 hypothetical protein [Baekduia sp.]